MSVHLSAPIRTTTVRLICDACGEGFLFDIPSAEIAAMPEFDPATAAALCTPCGDVLARLFAKRDREPAAYVEFRDRCAESVARKLGVVPAAN